MNKMSKPIALIITGPTASGKTEILTKISEKYPVEIISSDSRQIYRYMDIGTAAPDKSILKKIPHHLIQIRNPNEQFSSGEFFYSAKELLQKIISRKKIPIISGGTFFYIRSLWDGLVDEPIIPEENRKKIENFTQEESLNLLKKIDIKSYHRINHNDIYRIKRALLVSSVTGLPFSERERKPGIYNNYNFLSFYLDIPREKLYSQINLRSKIMLENGLLEEIIQLIEMGFKPTDPGLKTIGYKEFIEISILKLLEDKESITNDKILSFLKKLRENNKIQKKITEIISQKTRNYAKRQMTWFRNEKRLKSIDHDSLLFQISKILGDK